MLLAWPGQSTLARTRVGQAVRARVIGTATSSSTGSYVIRQKVALPNGIHNLQIVARSSVAVGAFAFARRNGSRALAPAGSAGTGGVTANITMVALPKSALPQLPICTLWTKTREYGQREVTVGGLYSLLFPAKMHMDYTAGSTTTISVGVSFAGEFSSFNVEGTFTETTSSTQHFPTERDETTDNMQTPYTFGQYNLCGLVHEVIPEQWATGDNEVSLFPPGATHCSHFNPGAGLTRNTGTAGTFSAGVSFKKTIGINLSAQSGYSKNVAITWTFPKGGYLCGTNALPSASGFSVMDPTRAGNPGP